MRTESFLITELKKDSIEDILKLQGQAIENGVDIIPSSKEMYKQAFMYDNFVYGLIQRYTGKLLGFCNCSIPTRRSTRNLGIGRVDNNELDNVGHINTIIIDVGHRGKGYGKQIIQKALDEFKSREIKYIFASVSPNNEASMKLFTHFQFSVIETGLFKGRKRNILKLNE